MYQRDTLFYSIGYSVNEVKDLIADWDENKNSETLMRICIANQNRFKRYLDFFDFYFDRREYTDISIKKFKNNSFNLSHDFIVMGNLCSVIETYYQFINGINQSPSKSTKSCYIEIFRILRHKNQCYTEENAIKFYKLIRNGLIHQTNTRISAALSEVDEPIRIDGDGCFLCNTELIYKDLRHSILNYFKFLPSKNIENIQVLNIVKKTKYILNNIE